MAKKKISKKINKKATKKTAKKITKKSVSKKSSQKATSLQSIDKKNHSQFDKSVFMRLSGRKLFDKICKSLQDVVGFHVINLFVFSTDGDSPCISLQGSNADKVLSWGGVSLDVDQKNTLLSFLQEQKAKPSLMSFPLSQLYIAKDLKATSIINFDNYKDCKQVKTIYLPMQNSEGIVGGALVISSIDSSTYTKNDVEKTLPYAHLLEVDVFCELGILYKEEREALSRLEKSKSNKIVKELRSSVGELQKAIDIATAELVLKEQGYQKELKKQSNAFIKKHEIETQALDTELNASINTFKKKQKEHEDSLVLLQEKSSKDLQARILVVEAEHQKSINDLKSSLKNEKSKLDSLQLKIEVIEDRNEKISTESESNINKLKEGYEDKISLLEKNNKDQVDFNVEHLKEKLDEYEKEKQKLQEKFKASFKSQEDENRETLKRRTLELSEKFDLDTLEKENHTQELTKENSKKRNELNEFKEKLDSADNINNDLSIKIDNLQKDNEQSQFFTLENEAKLEKKIQDLQQQKDGSFNELNQIKEELLVEKKQHAEFKTKSEATQKENEESQLLSLETQVILEKKIQELQQQKDNSFNELNQIKEELLIEKRQHNEFKIKSESTQKENEESQFLALETQERLEKINRDLQQKKDSYFDEVTHLKGVVSSEKTKSSDLINSRDTIQKRYDQSQSLVQKNSEEISNTKQELKQQKDEIVGLVLEKENLENIKTENETKILYWEEKVETQATKLTRENKVIEDKLEALEKTHQQSETNYHENMYEMRQSLDSETRNLQTKLQVEKLNGAQLEEELASIIATNQKNEKELNNRIKENELVISNGIEKTNNLLQKITDLESMKKGLETQKTDLDKRLDHEILTLRQTQEKLSSINETHELSIQEITKIHEARLHKAQDEIEEKEINIQDLQTKEEEIGIALKNKTEKYIFTLEKIKDLELSLQTLKNVEKENTIKIQKQESLLSNTNKHLISTQDELLVSKKNALELGSTIKEINSNIGICNERQAQLESEISDFKEELNQLQLSLGDEKQNVKELKEVIVENKTTIENLKAEILNHLDNENMMKRDIEGKEGRIDGFKKEGRILADLLFAISDLPDLEAKLLFLKNNFLGSGIVDRAVVFLLTQQDHLVFHQGLWDDEHLDIASGFKLPVNQTAFAQVLATLKPSLLKKDKNLIDLDLPQALKNQLILLDSSFESKFKKDTMNEFLIIPLSINKNANGIMILSFTKKDIVTKANLELAASISSLFSVALEFEKNRVLKKDALVKQDTLKNILEFSQNRFIRQNNIFHTVIGDTKEKLKTVLKMEDISFDIKEPLLELTLPVQMAELREQDLINVTEGLVHWIDTHGRIASEAIGLEFSNDLKRGDLADFVKNIGEEAVHLFWFIAECFENVISHSRAQKLCVRIQKAETKIAFFIVDNGEGLVRTSGSQNPENGTGLKALKDISELMGCNLELGRDKKGYGLSVSLVVNVLS